MSAKGTDAVIEFKLPELGENISQGDLVRLGDRRYVGGHPDQAGDHQQRDHDPAAGAGGDVEEGQEGDRHGDPQYGPSLLRMRVGAARPNALVCRPSSCWQHLGHLPVH